MERRLLLVFAITFVVLIAVQPLLMKYAGKSAPATSPSQQASTQQPSTPATQVQPPAVQASPVATVSKGKSVAAAPTTKVATSEQETIIENDLYRITFTNKGGQVKSWILKKYTDEKGQPLDLVNKAAAEQVGYPLSLFTYDPQLRARLNSVLYVPSETGENKAPASLTFEYSEGGLTVRKSFQFDHSYVIKTDITVRRDGKLVTAFPAWPAGFGDESVQYSYAAARIDYRPVNQDKVIRLSADRKGEKIAGFGTISTPFYWGGAQDQYFAALFLPSNPDHDALVTYRNSVEVAANGSSGAKGTQKVEVLGAAAGSLTGPTTTRIFVGPKSTDVLDSVQATPLQGQASAPDLGGIIDYGFFGIIAKPLFVWLKWTQRHWVSNWGWAIVILTVIINLALLPLRVSSMKSALKMQKVQPQVNAIKKKYEKYSMRDPRRAEMNQEISAVFKEHGANPVGGCLPMLLQMPFLFAFYTMLGVAIELRHAPWLWIRDLSAPDPYYILPIAIVISTLLMQKMTPTPGMDPAQQKIMNLFMPLMLGWISYKLAAGLGVYWVLSTVIGIVQQWVMNRTQLGREMRAELEKRARKKALKNA